MEKENESKEWEQLVYSPPYINNEIRLSLFGIEGNRTNCNETLLPFPLKYLEKQLVEGNYRFVVFVGDKIFYAPFKVTTPIK